MTPVDEVPAVVASAVAGAEWHTATPSPASPSTQIYRLVFDDRGDRYLKSSDGVEQARRLADEAARLDWLAGRLPVPQVVAFEHDASRGRAWLVTTALGGSPGAEPMNRIDGPGLAQAMAAGLRAVHAIDTSDCPFDAGLAARRAEAERRVNEGLVDASALDPAYRRYTPERLLSLWLESEPSGPEDLVVVHGDYTLDNVLFDGGVVSGYVGWGRCGVADRYVDLARAARSLAPAVGPELVVSFFDAYGIEHPALAKIDYYVLADEFL